MTPKDRIYIAGAGMVGKAIHRHLTELGYSNILMPFHDELDLRYAADVSQFIERNRPDYVFLTAAKVGGIMANSSKPVDFLHDNLMIQSNVMRSSWAYSVKKLLFLGSSCIYPKLCPQPIKEEYLMTGPLEETNDAYAIAKIAGVRLVQAHRQQYGSNFISAMPCNLYGPGDRYSLTDGHVIPAMIARFHEAKVRNEPKVTLWGTGTPLREFLYVDDLAKASVLLMQDYSEMEPINMGSGDEITIKNLADFISIIVGYAGPIEWEWSKPDGTPRKLLDSSRIKRLGWKPEIGLIEGIKLAYQDFTESCPVLT